MVGQSALELLCLTGDLVTRRFRDTLGTPGTLGTLGDPLSSDGGLSHAGEGGALYHPGDERGVGRIEAQEGGDGTHLVRVRVRVRVRVSQEGGAMERTSCAGSRSSAS